MRRLALYFLAPGAVDVREESVPCPQRHQVLVQTVLSAISAGSELLIFRGQFPSSVRETSDLISTELTYPLAYGYACVGQVVDLGPEVESSWRGRTVVALSPHASHFVCSPENLQVVPEDVPAEDAAFLPNAETAVNLVQDAAPILGERVMVLGQGIVGLLTAELLKEFPLSCLMTADRCEIRRLASAALGATPVLDPSAADFREQARQHGGTERTGFDLVLEVTGDPSALNDAIALTRYSGRIVVGSWYGLKSAPLDLGTTFHRSRLRILSSQVSSISPELSGRWDKARRFDVAWDAIRRVRPSKWISHRYRLEQAAQAYSLLDTAPQSALQVVFDYA